MHGLNNIELVVSKLCYPVAGKLVTEDLDPNLPALAACSEVFDQMAQYRHPPEYLVAELERRLDLLQSVVHRRVMTARAMSN